MAPFEDRDVEIQNAKGSDSYSEVVTVSTAGSPETVTPSNGNIVACAYIDVPSTGPNVGTNLFEDYILWSTDGGTVFHILKVGESIGIPGNFTDLRIDASKNGMKATVELRS